MAANIRQ